MNRICGMLLAAVICVSGTAQSDLRIGEWEAHLPYREANWVTQSEAFIYISTGYALIKLDKDAIDEGEFIQPEYITKIDGLTEANIDKIAYDNFNNQLIVNYANSNIDVIRGEEVINIPFIKDNTNIVGSREINEIHISDANTAYLAGAFGLINMDLKKLEFRFTTFTPSAVQTVTSGRDSVFMGLDDGLYGISKADANPIDFSRWTWENGGGGLPPVYNCTASVFYKNHLYAVLDGRLYKKENNGYRQIPIDIPSGFKIVYLTAEGSRLLVGLKNDQTFRAMVIGLNEEETPVEGGADCAFEVIRGIEDEDGRIWYADRFRGIRYTEGINFGCNILEFDSPFAKDASQIEVAGDRVFFASGGASDNFAILSNRNGIYVLENNQWDNINETRFPILNTRQFLNFVSIAPHPIENKVFMASYYTGLVAYDLDTEELTLYDGSNSKIQGTSPGEDAGRVAYVLFDDEGHLWMSNFASPKPIVVYTADGNWHNFDVPGNNYNLAKMVIDDFGYLWFTVVGNSGGVLVYDRGEKIADPTDDRYRFYSATNSELPSPLVYSLAKDINGDIWAGTSQGPVAFECDPFNDECKGSRRKVLQDSIAAFLLDTEEILSIEIDGANRKWFGTKNGIFVQSPDGEDQIRHFNTANSPLFDNTIVDLDYDEKVGRMYISSNGGIQSIRTESTGAKIRHQASEVYAFPNPVRPNYQGPIAIKGLGRDANVKITDLNGKLVHETQALGGQAIWDGRDYTGRKVATGVYLVFSSSRVSFDQSDDFVTRIMFIE